MESVYYWYDQEKLNSDCLADLYIFNVPYSTVKVEWDGGGGEGKPGLLIEETEPRDFNLHLCKID